MAATFTGLASTESRGSALAHGPPGALDAVYARGLLHRGGVMIGRAAVFIRAHAADLGARVPLFAALTRFTLATLASASLSFLLPIVLHEWAGLGERAAVGLSFGIAYAFNFLTLRRLVFASKASLGRDLWRYALVNALFRIAEFFAFSALRSAAILSYAAALLFVLTASTLVKFFAYRRLFGGQR